MSNAPGYALDNNEAVQKMSSLRITGNVVPGIWWQRLQRESGTPHWLAIMILADTVYWYRPIEYRDEQSGRFVEYRKRFESDLLQRSYDALADRFGVSKSTVKKAVVFLEDQGLVERHFREIEVRDLKLNNVLFLELKPDAVEALTHGDDWNGNPQRERGEPPAEGGATHSGTEGVRDGKGGGPTGGYTNTGGTRKTTQGGTQGEGTSLREVGTPTCARKEDPPGGLTQPVSQRGDGATTEEAVEVEVNEGGYDGGSLSQALEDLESCDNLGAENWHLATVFRDLFAPADGPRAWVGRVGKLRKKLVGMDLGSGTPLGERGASQAFLCSLYDMVQREEFAPQPDNEAYTEALPTRVLNYVTKTIHNRQQEDEQLTKAERRERNFAKARADLGI
jgi:hypothetical protein